MCYADLREQLLSNSPSRSWLWKVTQANVFDSVPDWLQLVLLRWHSTFDHRIIQALVRSFFVIMIAVLRAKDIRMFMTEDNKMVPIFLTNTLEESSQEGDRIGDRIAVRSGFI